ncbi:MAG: YraN family protein [Desulfobacterales bacterium]|nr:YraN family protein [Desulfobacterales bacterium]
MVTSRQTFGSKSEALAARLLKKKGYKILERNYRNKLGEIDIIAKEKGSIVFVEVKARKSNRFGPPKLAVTLDKQRKISKTALYYLKTTNQFRVKARFDVVSIRFFSDEPEIEIIKNAFDLAYP